MAGLLRALRRIKSLLNSGSKAAKKRDGNPSAQAIKQQAENLSRIVNESIRIASDTRNLDTKASRLEVAGARLTDLEELAARHSFLRLENLQSVRSRIDQLWSDWKQGIVAAADGNQLGIEKEQAGDIPGAIAVYEGLVNERVDTPHTYRRLAILYRRQKELELELRALDAAIENVPSTNEKHHAWFVDRRDKLLQKSLPRA